MTDRQPQSTGSIFHARGTLGQLLILGLLMTAIYGNAVAGEADRLTVGHPLARFKLIRPGVHRYLRYTVQGGRRSAIDIWTRTVTFEPHDGRTLLHIVQRWDEASGEPPFFVIQDSWFEPATFRPVTHIRRRQKDGKVEISGYRFLPDRIVGLADLPDNLRKDFAVASPEGSYNFEYDMELLQALPLGRGYVADIPFYDAGYDPPARYAFRVTGSATVPGPDGRAIDCWTVTADYNTGKVVSRFWFDKRTQLMIREEQGQQDGSTLVKTLLNPESADAAGA